MNPISQAVQSWRDSGRALNPPAASADVSQLERFAGFHLPADVHAYFGLADGMAEGEMDDHGVSFWSIQQTVEREPDARSPSDDCEGPALAFADVLISSWYFYFELRPRGVVVVRSGLDPDFEAPSLTDFFRIYQEDPDALCI